MDSTGRFVVAFESDRDDDGEVHIRLRAFEADGTPRVDSIKVDCMEPAQHLDPAVALDESGVVRVFWDEIGETEEFKILGRTYDEETLLNGGKPLPP